MVTKLETDVESAFVVAMEEAGYISHKGSARRGFSDRFFYGYRGRVVIVEFKKEDAPDKRKGEKLQDYFRDQFRRRGFEVHRVKGEEEADALLKALIGE